jgi:dienelactone hydrolase
VTRPRLDLVATPAAARSLVLVAHGGQEHSFEEPHDWRHAILRMWPFADAARRAAPGAQVGLVRYRYRGWNGDAADAAADLRHVLASVSESIQRIALVGHSMGGRAVFAVADGPRVGGVLGLAPWLPADEPQPPLDGRLVVLGHGAGDRIVDPRLTTRYAERARRAGVPVAAFRAPDEGHALLQRHGDWDQLVRRFVRSTLGTDGTGSDLDQQIDPETHPESDPRIDPDIAAALSSEPAHGSDPLPSWSRRRGTLGAVGRVAASRVRLRVR